MDETRPSRRRPLQPEDVQLAAEAFAAALDGTAEIAMHPHRLRAELARHILEQIFQGERDVERLSAVALERIGSERSRGTAH